MTLIQLAHFSLMALVPGAIGIITIFGRKKKDEKGDEETKSVTESKPVTASSIPSPKQDSSGNGERAAQGGEFASESDELSLEKLLQSLPETPVSKSDRRENSDGDRDTPNWLSPRANPPSRPMVVAPGEKGKRLVDAPQTVQRATQPEFHPSGLNGRNSGQETAPSYPRFSGLEEEIRMLEDEVKKSLETPERTAKPVKVDVSVKQVKGERQEPEKSQGGRTGVGFGPAFAATQGALESPGLVVITGPAGSGKTAFCFALAKAYLERDTACLFAAYDQPPSAAREGLKKLGCEVSSYESQFRFLMIDGFSGQSEGFSMEPYYVETPFDVSSLENTLVGSVQVFMGARVGVIIDSLDGFFGSRPGKDFQERFRKLVDRMAELQAIMVVTVDSEKLSKENRVLLEELAGSVVELEKKGPKEGRFRTRKLEGSNVKKDPEEFELDSAKGLVFV